MKQKQLYHVYTLPPSYQLRLITNTLGRRLPIRLDNLRRLHSTITEATCSKFCFSKNRENLFPVVIKSQEKAF